MPSKGPLAVYETVIQPDWIDYNGHLNVAWYVHIFDQAVDRFLSAMGAGEEHRKRQRGSVFAMESHITFQRELFEGETARVTVQMMDLDEKRLHLFMRLARTPGDETSATMEQLSLYVDTERRKAAPMPDAVFAKFSDLLEAHRALPAPGEAGRRIGFAAGGTG